MPGSKETPAQHDELAIQQRSFLTIETRPRRGLWGDAWRRLCRNRAALCGLLGVVVLLLVALCAPLLAPYPFDAQHIERTFAPIGTPAFPLGTDELGRDELSRLLYGARISLGVSVVAQLLVLLLGLPIGLLAGMGSGRLDGLLMRWTDVMYALPDLLVVIVLLAVFGHNLLLVPLVIGGTAWTTLARLVRARVLSLRYQEFVVAAEALGIPRRRLLLRHILPNTLTPVIIAVTFGVPRYIMLEATLSFLGLGAPPPLPSWGTMVSDGYSAVFSFPHLVLLPGGLIALTMLSFAFLGDGLRDALDPQSHR